MLNLEKFVEFQSHKVREGCLDLREYTMSKGRQMEMPMTYLNTDHYSESRGPQPSVFMKNRMGAGSSLNMKDGPA